jgi:NADH-quinone oxidoreductase subunit N
MNVKVLISANGLAVALIGIFPNTLLGICAFVLLRSL